MNQRGFIPIIVLIGVLAISGIGVAGVLYLNKTIPNITLSSKNNSEFTFSPNQSTPSASSNPQSSPQHLSAFQILLGRNRVAQPSLVPSPSAAIKASSPTPTSHPTSTSRSTQVPSPTPAARKNTCDINVIYGKLGGGASDPLLVTLTYSFSGFNNTYMTGAQWDFNGDGNWDTDMNQSNGIIEHTYGGAGSYIVKLQVKGSDGSVTDVCSKSVTVPSGITVRVTGRIYADVNCNNFPDPSEIGVANAQVRIIKLPEYSIYSEFNTDGSGNFNFSQNIQPNDSLSVNVDTGVVPYGYKSNPKFNGPNYSLGGSQTSMNIDIPIVPVENVGACF